MTELERMVVRLVGDASSYNRMLDKAESKTVRSMAKIEKVAKRMTMVVTTSLLAMAAVSIASFAKFDDAMTKSTAIMTGVTKELRAEMEKTALSLSTRSVTSAKDLADAYFFLASAGLDARQSMAALPAVQKFAAAGAFDMARATDLLTDAQSALGLTVKNSIKNLANMTRVSDVLIKANTLANATAEQFSKSLVTKSGAALRLLNKRMEEGVAVLAVFADQGVKGELAGERLAIVLRDLQTASLKNTRQWEAMGLSVFDATGNMRPIVEIVEQLETALEGATDKQKKQTLAVLGFTDKSQSAVTSLLGMSGKIREYEKALLSAGGTTEDVANKQMASFSSQLKITKNQLTAIAIQIGSVLAPFLTKLNEQLQRGLMWWETLTDSQKKWIVAVGASVAVAGPLMLIFTKGFALAVQFGGAIRTMGTLGKTAFAAIRVAGFAALLPFIKVIAVVALVSAAVAGLISWIGGPQGLTNAWESVKSTMFSFFRSAIGFFANFRQNMSTLWSWFRSNWDTILEDVGVMIVTMWANTIKNTATAIRMVIRLHSAMFGWVVGRFRDVFSGEFVKWVWKGIKKAAKAFISFAKRAWKILKGIFTGKRFSMKDLTNKMADDFKKGMSEKNLFKVFGDVIKDESKNFVSPLDGFKAKTKAPKLNFTIPTKDIKKKVETQLKKKPPIIPVKVPKGSKKLQKSLDKLMVKTQRTAPTIMAKVKFSAVDAASSEAITRTEEQRDLLNRQRRRNPMLVAVKKLAGGINNLTKKMTPKNNAAFGAAFGAAVAAGVTHPRLQNSGSTFGGAAGAITSGTTGSRAAGMSVDESRRRNNSSQDRQETTLNEKSAKFLEQIAFNTSKSRSVIMSPVNLDSE